MKVRAKMRCTKVGNNKYATNYGAQPAAVQEHEEVELICVAGPGNEDWSKYTPSGSAKMNITKEGACGQFEAGKDYFVDFTLAEEPAPAGE